MPGPSPGSVPSQATGMALGQDRLVLGVVQDELPLREDVVQLVPVVVQRLPVQVVFGPDLGGQVADALPELRPLAVPHHLRAHLSSIASKATLV